MQTQAQDGGVFQTQLWNDFQESAGKEVFESNGVFGQVSPKRFFLGAHAYAPRFPGVALDAETLQEFLQTARQQGWCFVRVEPQSEKLLTLLRETGVPVVTAPADMQPREILMLDITPSEEDLFAGMKSKTRYNIRLAQKKGVTVETTRSAEDIEKFLDIMEETADRKSIHFHPRAYYQKFIEHFPPEICRLFVAKKGTEILAGSLVLFFEKTAYYLHGGSGNEGRNLMAPHLLQREQIRFARSRGCVQYDFGGVAVDTTAPEGKDWSGITRFKQGFAPKTKTLVFPGTYDMVLKPLPYRVYRLLQRVRRYV